MMANESAELPVTPEVTKSCGVETRRYSAGRASLGNSDEKIVPHYLRASTGSCHDFCKYGRKHAFELKERHSIPNRTTRKQLHQSLEESSGGIIVSVARPRLSSVDSKPTKKMPMVTLSESIDSKTRISDTSDTNTHELRTKSFDSQKHIGNEVMVNRKKTSLVKVKPSLLLKSHTSPSTRQEISSSTVKEVQMQSPSKSTSKKVETPSKSTPKKVKTPSKSTPSKVETPSKSTPKVETPSISTPDKAETLSKLTPKKVENPSKSTFKVKTSSKSTPKMVGTSSQLPSLNGKEMKFSEKHVTSLNSNCVTRKKISSMNSSEGLGDKRNSEIKMEKGVTSSKVGSRKLMAPLKPLSSPRPSLKRAVSINSRKQKGLKIVSHLRNQRTARKVETEECNKVEPEEQNNKEVEEKTLYVIKMESENKTLQSDQNAICDDESYLPELSSPKSSSSSITQSLSQEDQEESEYTTSEFEQDSSSGNHEIECMENEGTLEVELEKKGKPRKDGVVCYEDKDCQMIKLKFRRGKVVENQTEKSGPRRLKFRRAKRLGEKANVKDNAQRKSFKRRDGGCADSDCETTPEKVVLRHQDMQDKKDAQGLLNNVIEETASKLVEARKSKVKALVGAFETVISLHEKKPSANTVS